MKRSLPLLLGVAGGIVAFDQWTKRWANAHLAWREPVRVIDHVVRLTYARNSGIAFSLLAGRGLPLYVFSLVAAVAVFALFYRHAQLALVRQLSLALILGGAMGNLIDRVRTGQVVDFILLSWGPHEFPVFNLADMAVTFGVVLFALKWTDESAPAAGDAAPGAPPPAGEAESGTHDEGGGPDGAGGGSGPAGGSLAREGADRPLA
ncbi:MAG TPA: signal peptidase II [Candidatus Acidoferrales bacterium]|nr:signal peptidase II [Candidatus Acidoferrales bacterium]